MGFSALLAFVASLDPSPTPLGFLEKELIFLQEFDKRAGLDPLTADQYMVFPRVLVDAIANFLVLDRLMSKLYETARLDLKSVIQYDLTKLPMAIPCQMEE